MKTAKKILLGLIALCAALAFAGCNNSGGPAVVSSWYCETNSTTLEFYDNGTFLLKDSSGSNGGTYTGDSTANSGTVNITIDLQPFSFEIKSDTSGYYLEFNGLKFYRRGSSPSPSPSDTPSETRKTVTTWTGTNQNNETQTAKFYDDGSFTLGNNAGTQDGTYTGDSLANSGTLNVTILGQTVSFEIKSDSNGYYLEYLGVKFYREGSSAPSSRDPLSGYYIRGDFDNNWTGIALTHISGNTYKADITATAETQQMKIATSDWSSQYCVTEAGGSAVVSMSLTDRDVKWYKGNSDEGNNPKVSGFTAGKTYTFTVVCSDDESYITINIAAK